MYSCGGDYVEMQWDSSTVKCGMFLLELKINNPKNIFFFPKGATAPSGPGPPHYRGFTIILRHTKLVWTCPEKWTARRRDLYLTTHNTHKRQDIYAIGGIRTRNPSKRTAANPRLRQRGQWDRLTQKYMQCELIFWRTVFKNRPFRLSATTRHSILRVP
jgi:hypothetical protein